MVAAWPIEPSAMPDSILIARHGEIECRPLPALANRHGLITGATGTGHGTGHGARRAIQGSATSVSAAGRTSTRRTAASLFTRRLATKLFWVSGSSAATARLAKGWSSGR